MKNKIVKYVLNGVVLAAIAAIGVAAYQIGTSPTEEKFIVEMEDAETDEMAMLEEDMAEDEGVNDWDNINGEDVETGKNGFAAEDYENEYLESSEFDDEYLEKSDFDKEYLNPSNLYTKTLGTLAIYLLIAIALYIFFFYRKKENPRLVIIHRLFGDNGRGLL